MSNIELVRNDPAAVRRAVAAKRIDLDVDELVEADGKLRAITHRLDGMRHELKTLSRHAAPDGSREERVEQARTLSQQVKDVEAEQRELRARFEALLARVPNVLAPEVPEGDDEDANLEVRRWGDVPSFDFPQKDHVQILTDLGMLALDAPRDFAGARAYALLGQAALLELAVLRYALDVVLSKGFTPVIPPVLVREKAMYGTGFFPFGREDTYYLPADELYLTGTSEVGLISLHANSILDSERLPIRYAGWSTCFRREAGAAGRDHRGLYRVHQFQKVEQVVICEADLQTSEREHYSLLDNAEEILQGLGLPYRVALASSAETGLGQYRKHEVETWMPSRERYSETHSCSTLLDFQARRSRIRYRAGSRTVYAHTLNNTAIASPRILIAILENNQNPDGTVTIPKVLQPYMGGLEVLQSER
jgi:seryl-tRNA synthetase